MENDLCSEKKRYEVFKEMKTKQITEFQENLDSLQKESHELKTNKIILEKSLEEMKTNLDKYLKNKKNLEDQNETLKTLWQDLQKQNETKDQQVQSLQKLNRSLSLTLNKKKEELGLAQKKKSVFSNQNLEVQEDREEDSKQSASHILADIHFD